MHSTFGLQLYDTLTEDSISIDHPCSFSASALDKYAKRHLNTVLSFKFCSTFLNNTYPPQADFYVLYRLTPVMTDLLDTQKGF